MNVKFLFSSVSLPLLGIACCGTVKILNLMFLLQNVFGDRSWNFS